MRNRVIVIAEAGVNHNGDIGLAKKLIEVAAEAGADFVKFQTFTAEAIVSKHAGLADYQKQNTSSSSQLAMLRDLELDINAHHTLMTHCNRNGISFLSTPFDIPSIQLLSSLGLTIGKIPSGEITNLPYLRRMAESFEELILSSGMSDVTEVGAALDVLLRKGISKSNITLLHCNTQYPTPYEDVNLRAMVELQKLFNIDVGYSDHTLGIEVPIAAVALGASVIEKHFTLDRNLPGPDHKASLDPQELKEMIKSIRNIEMSLGSSQKRMTRSETANRSIARKSIVANSDIKTGEPFTENNLTVKRPGTGISPMLWDDVIGKTAMRDFNKDELIEL